LAVHLLRRVGFSVGVGILGGVAGLVIFAAVAQMGSRAFALLAALVVAVVLVVVCHEEEG
jgi:hypothetical protein